MAVYINLNLYIQALYLFIVENMLQIAITLEKKHMVKHVLLGCNDKKI